jgi:cytochrome c6
MLAGVEKVVALISWVVAALVVLMLLIGPRIVAADESGPVGGVSSGETVFVENCGTCHTLSAAGTSGQVGPDLDQIGLPAAEIESIVESGRGGIMPSFSGTLAPGEISAVANFVAGAP